MRKFLILLFTIVFFVSAGVAGYRAYKTWKQNRAVKLAREHFQKGDGSNAVLWLRQALEANPNHVDASRLMADLAELTRSPQAIAWRARVVSLEPSLTNRVVYARTALGFGDPALATRILSDVDDAGKQTVLYHKTAGAVAVAANRFDDAERHLTEAARLEPTNTLSRLNLAVLRLQRNDPKVVAESRAILEQLTQDAVVRNDALRQLTVDALRGKQTDRAMQLTQQLLAATNSLFSDRLLYLDVLREAKNAQLQPALTALQHEASTNVARSYDVAKWMMGHGSGPAAYTWLQSLPAAVRTNQPLPMLAAECQALTKDWSGLETALDKQDWGEMDCLRLAYRARALRERNLDGASKAEFAKALQAAGGRVDRLTVLLRATTDWKWAAERNDVLWGVVNGFPGEKWAVQALADSLQEAGQSRSLLTLFAKAASLDPKDLVMKNNLASIALLLNATEHKPHDLAREVYDQAKTNPFFATTYAFSLYLQQKPAEALKVLDQVKPQALEQPQLAGYYALALQATGDASKAATYFGLANKARLLPEEAALFKRVASAK